MSVRTSKRGKSSHEQKPVRGSAGGDLFLKAVKGKTIKPVRGAAGGLLFLKSKKSKSKRTHLATPSFEHGARRGTR